MENETKKFYFYALTVEGDLKTTRYIGTTSVSIKKDLGHISIVLPILKNVDFLSINE